MSERLLVVVDVDGVLNVVASAKVRKHRAYHEGWIHRYVDAGGLRFRLFMNPATGPWLARLARETGAELAWGTTWEGWANLCVGPLLGLPEMPVVPVMSGGHKADGIVPWTAGRPFVWFEDEPDAAEVTARLAGAQPHLVVQVDETTGLTEEHIAIARDWLKRYEAPRGASAPPA